MTITSLKGVGEKTAQLFEKLDITTTDDLLVYYPRDYEYFSAPVTLEQAATDEVTAVWVVSAAISRPGTCAD